MKYVLENENTIYIYSSKLNRTRMIDLQSGKAREITNKPMIKEIIRDGEKAADIISNRKEEHKFQI